MLDAELACGHEADEITQGECKIFRPDRNDVARHLAAPFAKHPDYDATWAP